MKKILVIDDEEDILITLKTFLTRKNYDTVVSMSCDEGLEIFYSFKPDVVILDVNVGKEDGRIVCKKIKSQAEYQHIPVLLISADAENFRSFADYGANSTMLKPFDFDKLISLIEEVS